MANVVKKGYVDVKKKGLLFGPAYKKKYVILKRDTGKGIKQIEIYDNENLEDSIQLEGMWSVQERESQNKRRFAFELVVGAHVIMTFSCHSSQERSEWTESFRILNSISSNSPVPPIDDMFHVILEHNIFSSEMAISGPCLLRVQDGSIVLYSENGLRKLHHWAFENVHNISMADDQVILDAYRPSSDSIMQFRFNTDFDSSRNILIACSLLLDNDKKRNSTLSLNNVGMSVSPADPPAKSHSLSKGFLGTTKPHKSIFTKDDKGVRRVKSFTGDKSISVIRRSVSPDNVTNNGSIHSMDQSYNINRPLSQAKDEDDSPPPIPRRAPRRPLSSGPEIIGTKDPDYSYIKDDVIDGSVASVSTSGRPKRNLSTNDTDQQLDDLLHDIEEDNKHKKLKKIYGEYTLGPAVELSTKPVTLDDFEKLRAEYLKEVGNRPADDYLEPVPSKTAQDKKYSSPVRHRDWKSSNTPRTKRYSSSTDYTLNQQDSPSHDYHTIPDKPQHGHTSSMDSTHANGTLQCRTQSTTSEEPPSPPLPPRPSYLTQIPKESIKQQHVIAASNASANVDKNDVSPYAIAKGIITTAPPTEGKITPPPLPPRSPNKHHREKIVQSSHSHGNNRCQKCNGTKSTTVAKLARKSPPAPFPLTAGNTHTLPKVQQADVKDKSSYGYGNEIDSALAMLDECVRDLNVLDTDNNNTSNVFLKYETTRSPGTSLVTDIDKAIKSVRDASTNLSQTSTKEVSTDLSKTSTREVGTDLSKTSVKRTTSLHHSHHSQPQALPHNQVSLGRGSGQTLPATMRHFTSVGSTHYVNNNGLPTHNNHHHMPIARYHSSIFSDVTSTNTPRVQGMRYV